MWVADGYGDDDNSEGNNLKLHNVNIVYIFALTLFFTFTVGHKKNQQ